MTGVAPGLGMIYFQPYQESLHQKLQLSKGVPDIVLKNHLFSITAYNPMGNKADKPTNVANNKLLQADLDALQPPPVQKWHSFGFSTKSSKQGEWREDGFTLAFKSEDSDAARTNILDLARKYKQGAIY